MAHSSQTQWMLIVKFHCLFSTTGNALPAWKSSGSTQWILLGPLSTVTGCSNSRSLRPSHKQLLIVFIHLFRSILCDIAEWFTGLSRPNAWGVFGIICRKVHEFISTVNSSRYLNVKMLVHSSDDVLVDNNERWYLRPPQSTLTHLKRNPSSPLCPCLWASQDAPRQTPASSFPSLAPVAL